LIIESLDQFYRTQDTDHYENDSLLGYLVPTYSHQEPNSLKSTTLITVTVVINDRWFLFNRLFYYLRSCQKTI